MKQSKKQRRIDLPPVFRSKTFALIGIILLTLLIPITIFRSNQQTNFLTSAAPSTTLSFDKSSVQANAGDPIALNIQMNPGSNAVSFVTLVLNYDSLIVKPASNGFIPGIIPGSNPPTQFSVFDGPTYNTCNGTKCTMSVTLSVGSDFTRAVKIAGILATVNLQAVGDTTQGPMQLAFDPQTTIYSVAAGDSSGENVLANSSPSLITIGNGATNTITPSPIPSATPIPTDTTTPPTGTTVSPSPKPSVTGKPTPKPTGVGTNSCDDDDLKKREKKETIREKNEKLKEDQVQAIMQHLSQKGKGQGGCLGQLDPNNPNKNVNCDTSTIPSIVQQAQDKTSPSIIDSIGNFFSGLFR